MSVTLSYHHPTIGPKAYMARASSGWAETFPRKEADDKLVEFLGGQPLVVVVGGFRNQVKKNKSGVTWALILDYLAMIASKPAALITGEIGIAFWCQYLLVLRDDEGAN